MAHPGKTGLPLPSGPEPAGRKGQEGAGGPQSSPLPLGQVPQPAQRAWHPVGCTLSTSDWQRCQAPGGPRRAKSRPLRTAGLGGSSTQHPRLELWAQPPTGLGCGPSLCLGGPGGGCGTTAPHPQAVWSQDCVWPPCTQSSPAQGVQRAWHRRHHTPAWALPWAQHFPQLTSQLSPHPPHPGQGPLVPMQAGEGPLTHGRATCPGQTPLQLRSRIPPASSTRPRWPCQHPPGAPTDPTAWPPWARAGPTVGPVRKRSGQPCPHHTLLSHVRGGNTEFYLPARLRPAPPSAYTHTAHPFSSTTATLNLNPQPRTRGGV